MYLNRRYSYLKSVKLCANMYVKNLFTSDTEYEPGNDSVEASFYGHMQLQ